MGFWGFGGLGFWGGREGEERERLRERARGGAGGGGAEKEGEGEGEELEGGELEGGELEALSPEQSQALLVLHALLSSYRYAKLACIGICLSYAKVLKKQKSLTKMLRRSPPAQRTKSKSRKNEVASHDTGERRHMQFGQRV